LAPRFVDGDPDDIERTAAAVIALARQRELTAVLCGSDVVALAVVAATRATGVVVPRDLSVVGFDDIDAARLSDPPLTTVRVDWAAMGRLALTMLEHRITRAADPPFTVLQRTLLIERATVVPPSSRRRT
jgi:DNA-binding LacI/PurR family transcriptional regulator